MSYIPQGRLTHQVGIVREALQGRIQQDQFFLTLLLESIAIGASEYFENCVDDFCLQFWQGESIIFGGTNRLWWSARRGYTPELEHCTQDFLTHYEAVESRKRA